VSRQLPATINIGRHFILPDEIRRYEVLTDRFVRVHLRGNDQNGTPDYLDFIDEEADALLLMLDYTAVNVVEIVRKATESPYSSWLFPDRPIAPPPR
jgi:hypothetical protein